MASISAPTFSSPSTRSDSNTHKFALTSSIFSSGVRRPSSVFHLHSICSSTSHFLSSSRVSDTATLCRCYGNNNGEDNSESGSPSEDSWRWDSAIRDIFRNALKRMDDYMSSPLGGSKPACLGVVEKKSEVVIDANHSDEEWDWDRWRKHFDEIDGQERILSILKSQLAFAVKREDYDDAARLKVAIAAATTNDAVVRVMAQLNKAIKEERYHDAAFMRDIGGAGLVGWWAGISDDDNDPYGRIIRISAEHGRYVARSYSPRELTTTTAGAPLFEIFLTMNRKGGYKLKAVYLKRMATSQDSQTSLKSLDNTGSLNALDPDHNKSDMFVKSSEDTDDDDNRDDDSDTVEGPFGFENILRDMIPGVKVVKVLKVTTPVKADRDLISKVIDQMMAEEDEENDAESESVDMEDGTKAESDEESNEIDLDAGSQDIDAGEQSQVAVKLVIGGLTQQISSKALQRELLRVPARLEKKGHKSFSFSIEKVTNRQVSSSDGKSPPNKKAKVQSRSSLDHVLFDLARFIGRGKIPMKVLKDLTELINLTLRQAQTHQPLSESTTFNRIEISASPDPLNGLYIGSHGLYTSEVIHLRRQFGQWQDDDSTKKPPNLEFYEYVEAVKLTGDPYVPAGQVAFRVKVGKRYLLPHEGIIPEEFGVIARYKGQGRLAEPGFQNPRWVDGELVILDGKFIKGPVIGFLYWAPEYHFLVFFSRLRLQE